MLLTKSILIKIPKDTKPDIPNINGKVYTKESYDSAVKKLNLQLYYMPFIQEDTCGECLSSTTFGIDLIKLSDPKSSCKLLGSVAEIHDDYIIIEVLDELLVEHINDLLNQNYTAHMNYTAERLNDDTEFKINKIIYFSLCKSNHIRQENEVVCICNE